MESAKSVKGRNSWAQDARSGPMGKLHNGGRVYYRNKQYQAAVICFTQAINGGIEDVISVLDNRSAAFTKLGNLQAALLDGQKMIKQDNANVTGYLRAGKVLMLMGKLGTARDLYERGIGRVQVTDLYFPLLRKLHLKLAKRLDFCDPFKTLPLEVAQMVLSYLEFPDICNCTNVSKLWRELLGSVPTLWTDLNFIKAKKPLQEVAIRAYIKRGKGLPTRVTLPKSVNTKYNLPRFITTRCKGLYELVFTGGMTGETIIQAAPCATNLKTLIVGSECRITNDTVDQLLERCKALERAEFHDCLAVLGRAAQWNADLPNLQSLILDFTRTQRACYVQKPVLNLEKLIKRIPNIRRLILRSNWSMPSVTPVQVPPTPDFSCLKQLETLDISGMTAKQAPKFPCSLHSLDISNIDAPQPDVIPDQFTQLVRLSAANARQIAVSVKLMLEMNKGRLAHVDATGTLSAEDIRELILNGYFQSVVELKLGMCAVNDELAIMLAEHAPNIKILHLEGTNITGVGVKELVRALKGQLDFLRLDECLKCSEDANKWAVSMGVKTSFRFPDHERRGGRRLRSE